MRSIFYTALMAFFIISSCKKETIKMPPFIISYNDTSQSNLAYSGSFNGVGGQSVIGESNIYNNEGKYTLVLNNFFTSAGPDLHVYLSQEAPPIHFIDLGKLKSNSGLQVYEIPNMPNFNLYTFVLIHCQQYNHLFGISALK